MDLPTTFVGAAELIDADDHTDELVAGKDEKSWAIAGPCRQQNRFCNQDAHGPLRISI